MAKLRLGFLASGRGSNLQAILDQIEAGGVDAEAAVLISDKADAFALQRADNHGVLSKHINPRDFASRETYEEAILQVFESCGVDLVILAGYMRLIGDKLIEAYPNRIMNIHPALLPSFPGVHGQRDALAYGVRFSGCTVHFVDKGMDTGPIILQAVVPVLPEDDEEALSARILKEEHKIYSEAIRLFAEGRLQVDGRRVIIK